MPVTIRFVYIRPTSVEEAVRLLNEPGVLSRPLAGGTDLLVARQRSQVGFDRLVDISRLVELKKVRGESGRVHVGAGVTFTEVIESEFLQRTVPSLIEACQSIGGPQIRNAGTLGGNIANAAPCADSLPVLVGLGATAHLCGVDGVRQLLVEDLVVGPYHTRVQRGELVTGFSLEIPPPSVRQAFTKLGRRNALAISRLSMMALGRTTDEGLVDFVRLVPGSAFTHTTCCRDVEALLLGQRPSQPLLAEAGALVAAMIFAQAGRRWSAEYKDPSVRALAERSLARVLLDIHQQRDDRTSEAG
jgi:CO/xanthine dehydrogenase FAD-binding subunit